MSYLALGFAFSFSSSSFSAFFVWLRFPFLSVRFLVLPCVLLGPCFVTRISLPLVLPPLSDRSLLLGSLLPPLLLPSGCFCCLVHCFTFLRISRLASARSFLVLPVLWLCL